MYIVIIKLILKKPIKIKSIINLYNNKIIN